MNLRDQLWDEGLAFLGKDKASLIGRLLKLSGDDPEAVLDEIRLAKARKIALPIPFLLAAFQKPRKRRVPEAR
jgi:hypothetical protein